MAARLVSDVPIACFLSGGIDSAIIASLARNHTHIDTFTAGFDQSLFDESKIARETAKHLGTNHHEVRLKEEDQFGMIDQLLNSALDEPFGDSSALPSLFVPRRLNHMLPSRYQVMVPTNYSADTVNIKANLRCVRGTDYRAH